MTPPAASSSYPPHLIPEEGDNCEIPFLVVFLLLVLPFPPALVFHYAVKQKATKYQ